MNHCVTDMTTSIDNPDEFNNSNVASENTFVDLLNVQDDQPNLEVSGSAHALTQRKQPLMELVTSEEGYVRRLRMVRDYYMPLVSNVQTPVSTDTPTLIPPTCSSPREAFLTAPPVPEDLAVRWRILWGNWVQLYEWHSTFLDKLQNVIDSEPDKIPKLFIDSRARLRSIYSKYCENHRKAALIAEQYREYLEELRIHFSDKEDVVSYLMQPVQRIMRYQLPMSEIVKYTERAGSSSLALWKKALDIMKEIPKDTQLILEAARIEGFPGVITALGNILIRGDLLVATTPRDQLLEMVTCYKHVLQISASSLGLCDPKVEPTACTSPHSSNTVSLISGTPGPDTVPIRHGQNESNRSLDGTTSVGMESSGLFTGSLRFIESRLFLFEQMLVVTEESKPKRRAQPGDVFGQSTYQFRAAINVNKMRYEPHWYNLSLPNGRTNADAAAVDHYLAMGIATDDMRFAVLDQSPGRTVVYVIDPITSSNRGAWVVQLRNIQRMQNDLLLALQDPRRFEAGRHDDPLSGDVCDSSNLMSRLEPHDEVLSVHSQSHASQQQQQRTRKWPSFTVKRSSRLGSSSLPDSGSKSHQSSIHSPTSSKSTSPFDHHHQQQQQQSNGCKNSNYGRSISAERRPISNPPVVEAGEGGGAMRKSSLKPNSLCLSTTTTTTGRESVCPGSKNNVVKKRNVFASLFGRNKSKQRNYKHTTSSGGFEQPNLPRPTTDSPTSSSSVGKDTQLEGKVTAGVSTSG